ncbi:MAG: hypothetical protein MI892_10760 [Desulfobacterales bacterium]|nr:hypothetical protein [Desulfobacterales bacterium]
MMNYSLKMICVEGSSHLFACKGFSHLVALNKLKRTCLFKRQLYANLYKVDNYILKVCYGQSIPKDVLRKYAFKSQAEREFKSAEILSQIGLKTPKSYFSAFSLFPLTKGWVESIHEMEFLHGFEDLNPDFIHRPDCLKIISCFAKDLAIITNAMFCPKDLGLGNTMFNPKQVELAWLDTDLKKITNRKKLAVKMMSQLRPRFFRYLNRHQAEMFWAVFCETSNLYPEKEELLISAGIKEF